MTEEILTADPPATETPTWNSGVAEEHQTAISGFTDVPSLAKGYSELYGKMGNRVQIPTAETPAQEVSAFWKQLGRPDTAEGYKSPEVGEGQEVNKEFFDGMAAAAHTAGMSSEGFDGFVAKYMDFEAKTKEAEVVEFNRYREEADRKLHEEYGADYDKNIELSKRAYTEYASDDLKELLETDKWKAIRNEPAFIDMMVEMGKKNMDDTFVQGDGQPPTTKTDFTPSSPNSPEMYATMEGEEGKKNRDYFRAKGHKYDRAD